MTESFGDVPLTELCAICHIEPIKYTCPRCGIHTCALPCVKRHKQWAQCSGVRDPAAYRKRTELATESSIDQDFNFITKVERSLQRAEDGIQDRGIQLAPATGKSSRTPQGLPKFDSEVVARHIKLMRAPQGLSRSKQNKSHWAGPQKGIMWTVEWLTQDGERRVNNVAETKSIAEAYVGSFGKKGLRRKRKREDAEYLLDHTNDNNTTAPSKDGTDPQQPGDNQSISASTAVVEERNRNRPADCEVTEEMHFYLHRPLTASKLKYLIPISGSATFQETLKGKTLLEHPTIHIRYEKPEELSEPFALENVLTNEVAKDVQIEEVSAATATIPSPTTTSTTTDIDANRVLYVLHQDLNG